MRPPVDNVIGVVLTIPPNAPLDADGYKRTGDTAYFAIYKEHAAKEMKALTQALWRKHQIKGRNWRARVQIAASCEKVRDGISEPARFHYHVMVDGLYADTIAKTIRDYWQKRYKSHQKDQYKKTWVEFKRQSRSWLTGYMDEQALAEKSMTMGDCDNEDSPLGGCNVF